jgi:glutathione S-transferase
MHLVNWMQRVLILVILITSLAVAEAFAGAPTMSVSPSSVVATKHRLFDMPVSNNGARCRLIVYKKRLPESEVAILSPMDIGGMKSKEYLALNPQGKIPLMIADEIGMPIPESDTICRYLISKYSENGPSFQPENTKSNLIARLHDMYL